MTAAELSRLASELGLDAVGAAPAEPYETTEEHIRDRRERGLFADMRFTMARPEVSCHPEQLLEGARTVVSAALCYFERGPDPEPDEGRLPRYTWRDGYADLRARLDELGTRLGGRYRVLVDDNDHVDREGAVRAGVGFYGKNTMVITPSHGSWVVLGTLVTDVEIEPTPRVELDCGSCRLCIDACPTGALDEPGELDATACSRTGRRRRPRSPRPTAKSWGRWSTDATSARTCARGTVAVESVAVASERRARDSSPPSRCGTGSSETAKSSSPISTVSTCHETTHVGCAATRSSRPGTSARDELVPLVERYASDDDPVLRRLPLGTRAASPSARA